MDPTSLMIGVIAGAFGLGYFVYGKKQQKAVPLICGIGLMVVPYVLNNLVTLSLVCLALTIMPWIIRM